MNNWLIGIGLKDNLIIEEVMRIILALVTWSWAESLSTLDMQMVSYSLIVGVPGLVYVIWRVAMSREGGYRKLAWLAGMVVAGALWLMILLALQIGASNYLAEVREPRAVQYQRVTPELLSIKYRTYDPELPLVLWGYNPEYLQYSAIGGVAHLAKEHELLLRVDPEREVYFVIVVGGRIYDWGREKQNLPYFVETSERVLEQEAEL